MYAGEQGLRGLSIYSFDAGLGVEVTWLPTVHLATPDIILDTHIQDIVNVLVYEDLWQIVLVGHSYAGVVITGVADRVPDRVAQLVYLDAIVPRAGESILDGWSPAGRTEVLDAARAGGDGWRWPVPPDLADPPSGYGLTPDDTRWLYAKAVAHPLKTFTQPLMLRDSRAATMPRTYILCTAERTRFPDFVDEARGDPSWQFHELPTGHYPMISMPRELAQLLRNIGGFQADSVA